MPVIENATVVFSPQHLRDLKMLEEAGIDVGDANDPADPHSITADEVDVMATGHVEVKDIGVIFSPAQVHHIERP